MLAFFLGFLLLLSGAAATGEAPTGTWGSIREFWDHYLNYPGYELWKFINLGLFVFGLYYVSKRLKLSDTFKAKREEIRAELIKAEAEKKAALEELTKVETKLVGVDAEKDSIMTSAREEIETEKKRLAEQADLEAGKLSSQADGEIARLGAVANVQLRKFAVIESVRMAEVKLRSNIDPKVDVNLVKAGIRSIGEVN